MTDDLETKVDRIEQKLESLIRQVEGDEKLGVLGLRDYIKANEDWKRTTENLLQKRDRNIIVDHQTLWLYGIIIFLSIVVFIFILSYLRNTTWLSLMNTYDYWLYPYFLLWFKQDN